MDCKVCKDSRATVPLAVLERVMLSYSATIKRLWVIIIILIALLVGSVTAQIEQVKQPPESLYVEQDPK